MTAGHAFGRPCVGYLSLVFRELRFHQRRRGICRRESDNATGGKSSVSGGLKEQAKCYALGSRHWECGNSVERKGSSEKKRMLVYLKDLVWLGVTDSDQH